jgi:ribulose-phosphate 3-epimerase
MISVHVETTPHLHRTIARIKSRRVKAGAVINPSTPVGALDDIAGDLDFVRVMSVNPGFSGQAFIRHSLDKVRRVRQLLDRIGSSAPIEIDGGIDQATAAEAVAAGASILVAGNAIFGTPDAEAATRALRATVSGVTST